MRVSSDGLTYLFRIREGDRLRVTGLRFEGNTAFTATQLRILIGRAAQQVQPPRAERDGRGDVSARAFLFQQLTSDNSNLPGGIDNRLAIQRVGVCVVVGGCMDQHVR